MSSSSKHFFKLSDAISADMPKGGSVFIIGNDRVTNSGKIGRYFTVFPNYRTFEKYREKFPNSHELLVDHCSNEPDLSGRLVFDFDIPLEITVPEKFTSQIEKVIKIVLEKYYDDIDLDLLVYVWSTSKNPKKFSKHLTVKNLCFDHWVSMSKIFYRLLSIEWNKKYKWIAAESLVDFQIVRNNASLRMTGSSKINGYELVLDNPDHTLQDSLIRTYRRAVKETEQIVTKKNILDGVLDKILNIKDPDCHSFDSDSDSNCKSGHKKKHIVSEAVFPEIVYQKAFELVNSFSPNVFSLGKINGSLVSLLRHQDKRGASRCLMSGKVHEHDNAYVIISLSEGYYNVYYGCHRKCSKYNTKYIGAVEETTYEIKPGCDVKIPPRSRKTRTITNRNYSHTSYADKILRKTMCI
jgi:hypothetical protein